MMQSMLKELWRLPCPRRFAGDDYFSLQVRAIFADMYEMSLNATQYLSLEAMKKLQDKRLMHILRQAALGVPFYSDYLSGIRSIEDFHNLAPVTKERMRQELDAGRTTNSKFRSYAIPQFTSGSTGVPFHFFLDRNMLARRAAIYRRMLSWAGRTREDVIVSLMPKIHPGLEQESILLYCGGPQDVDDNLSKYYQLFENKSLILQSRTSHLIRLAQLMARDIRKFNFKALISYTEQLFPEGRRVLGGGFGAPIFNYYASNEITAIGQECELHNGFHVNSEWVLAEVVDDEGRKLEPGGEGNIILTSLDNEVMPFIKYKIGDRGHFIPGACRCGRSLPRLYVEGRNVNSFPLSNGKIGYFSTLIYPITSIIHKIYQYQVIRHSVGHFSIAIVRTPDFGNDDKNLIIEKFQDYLGKSAKVDFKETSFIEATVAGKQRAFLNMAQDDYMGGTAVGAR